MELWRKAEFEGAAGLYTVYLSKSWGGAPKPAVEAYQLQYYLAEIYFYRLDRPTDAATHYMASARAIPNAAAAVEPTAPATTPKSGVAVPVMPVIET